MSKKATVIRPGGTTSAAFHRTVRKDGKPVLDEAGNPRVLTFPPGQGVELSGDELEAVRDDIGNVLHIAKVDAGKPVVKIDGEATAKFVEETKAMRAKQAEKSAQAEAKAETKALDAPLTRRDLEKK